MKNPDIEVLSHFYEQRREEYKAIANTLRAKYDKYSIIRLLVFFVGVGVAILTFDYDWMLGLAYTLCFLPVFYHFSVWHQNIKKEADFNEQLSIINKTERKVLEHDYSAFPDGSAYIDVNHAYSPDLDIFGPYSIFQLLNRTQTILGEERLATWLETPAELHEIKDRQTALVELRNKLDWRQQLQAIGHDTEDQKEHLTNLIKWLDFPTLVLEDKGLRAALWFVPLWSILSILGWIYLFQWQAFLLCLLPVFFLLRKTTLEVNNIQEKTAHAEQMLAHYGRLINHIENEKFATASLQQLQNKFLQDDTTASQRIKRLSYIISQLNVRYNAFSFFLNLGVVWDLQWVYQLEKWKQKEKEHLPLWFNALADMEALSSLSNLWYNNPQWILPTFTSEMMLTSKVVGHPLIHADHRVCNTINIPLEGHIKLVTGSNMAGKSTFLRTLGLNAVLAMAGAPVCAEEFSLPRMRVYTSMRLQDALHESTSSFYAELKRLKFIIEAVAKAAVTPTDLPTFFLLDEILKGTNSVDRHTGSKALIRQLIRLKGAGIIATHDLELGGLEQEANGTIENLCFEVEIKDKQLFFDYTVKKGVCQSFNATLLMQQMGIAIEE